MGPSKSDQWVTAGFFGGGVRVMGITHFLSIGNCLFKVFSLILKKSGGIYIKDILLGEVSFLHFSVFSMSRKILFLYEQGETSMQTLEIKNKNEEQKSNKKNTTKPSVECLDPILKSIPLSLLLI